MAESPTSRTLRALRDQGWVAEVVERRTYIPAGADIQRAAQRAGGVRLEPMSRTRLFRAGVTHDLFGCIDLLAMREGQLLGVQATSGDNAAARVRKIVEDCRDNARLWLSTGARLEVWSWRKYQQAVKRRKWRETVRPVTMEDLT